MINIKQCPFCECDFSDITDIYKRYGEIIGCENCIETVYIEEFEVEDVEDIDLFFKENQWDDIRHNLI